MKTTERRQILEITSHVTALIGAEYFASLIKHLAAALSADLVLAGEFVGGRVERLRVLAACSGEKIEELADQELAGSLAAQVAAGETAAYHKGVCGRFPDDALLAAFDAKAAVAVPLLNQQRDAIGVLMAVYRQVLANSRVERSMLEIFAPRASAELRHKQEEATLRESAQRYRAFIAENVDAMARVEFEKPIPTNLEEDEQIAAMLETGYLAECNDAMARFIGFEHADDAVGTTFEQLSRQADPHIWDHLRSAIRSGYRFSTMETEPVDHDGNRRCMIRSHWGIVENGSLQRIWGTLRDVTALRRTEAARDRSERRVAKLLQSMHLVTLALDSDWGISYCNDYLLRLTGWDASEIAGKSWFDLMVPPNEREKLQAAFLAAKTKSPAPHQFEGTLLAKNGRRWLISWEGSALRDSKDAVIGFAGVGRDITLQKAMEKGLRQSEALQSLRSAARASAGELEGFLTAVSGQISVLSQTNDLHQARSVAQEMTIAVDACLHLTRQFSTLSGATPFARDLVDINELITEAAGMLRQFLSMDITLTTELDPLSIQVRIDRALFRQLLLGLGLNARDAMPKGGTVLISSAAVEVGAASDLTLKGIQTGDYVRVSVADTGPDRTEDVLAFIEEPFFASENDHAGMGLLNMSTIVQQAGGKILVDQENVQGTTIDIYLPSAVGD